MDQRTRYTTALSRAEEILGSSLDVIADGPYAPRIRVAVIDQR